MCAMDITTILYLRVLFFLTLDEKEESHEDLPSALKLRYKHPDWEAVLLCPWLEGEETLSLSQVYTRLEMESVAGRQSKPLKDYTDLFNSEAFSQNQGSRILIQAHPGMGKTTFTHKVALDWAEGKLSTFSVILVVKLRELLPNQTMPNAIMSQMAIENTTVFSEQVVYEHLTVRACNTLLILDGLDEIDMKKYPQVRRILSGLGYPSCCVMATSRPHLSPTIKNEMSCVANITGFSLNSAREYVSHIIPKEDTRKLFFKQLTDRKMQGMLKVPIILQALAFLFSSNSTLPDTYTTTYDELELYLQKTCEAGKNLTSEQIAEAMKLVNELAFRGLTQEVQQLVFPRQEITNENIFKLGILSATKTVTGFNPTASVQFLHKTVQEHATAKHVTDELQIGNRQPWERIKNMYKEPFTCKTDTSSYSNKKPKLQPDFSNDVDQNSKAAIIGRATKKFVDALMQSGEGKEAAIKQVFKIALDSGFLDDDLDRPMMNKAAKSHYSTQKFTEEEFDVAFNFMVDLFAKADKEQTKQMKELTLEIINCPKSTKKFAVMLQMISFLINKDPTGFAEYMISATERKYSSGDTATFQAISPQVQWLQDQANSMKILFRFILGKLPPDLANQILGEIAEMLVEYAFDLGSGEVLSIYFLKKYINDLMLEAGISYLDVTNALYSSDTCDNVDTCVPTPAIIHVRTTTSFKMVPSDIKPNALILEEIKESLAPITQLIENTQNLTILELHKISASHFKLEECKQLADSLSTSRSLVSLFLDTVDGLNLVRTILSNLSSSTRRLAIRRVTESDMYKLPPEVSLQCLYIEDSISGVAQMFTSNCPNLETLSIMSRFKWTSKDIKSFHSAVTDGRLPLLKHLCIRFGNLGNHGKYLVDIIRQPSVKTVDLMDTSLTHKDGRIILAALEDGIFTNIQSLNLLHNQGINTLVPELISVCNKWQIDVQCNQICTSLLFRIVSAFQSIRSKCTIL